LNLFNFKNFLKQKIFKICSRPTGTHGLSQGYVLLKLLDMDYAIAGAKEGVKAFLKAFKPAEILFALIIVFF